MTAGWTRTPDGEELLRIIGAGLDGEPLQLPRPDASAPPSCPECGSAMVRRKARCGPHVGKEFWGMFDLPAVPRDRADSRGRRGRRVSLEHNGLAR
jgi:hypothetical protein